MAGNSAPAAADSKDDDQYIAQMLAKDAQECSVRYSSLGMYAPAAKRPAERMPKPNTRFLRNILRETDTHNANLKRKEEEEARERMRQLRRNRASDVPDSHDRHGGERHSKRRRVESPVERERDHDRDRRSHRSRDDDREERSGGPESRRRRERRHGDERRDEDHRSKRSHHHHRTREDDGSRRHHRRRDGSRNRDPPEEEYGRDRERRRRKTRPSESSRSPRRRSRSRSRSRNRSDHREDKDRDDRKRVSKLKPDLSPSPRPGSSGRKRPSSTSKNTARVAEQQRCIIERSDSEDSEDELNALIGPPPPPDADTPPIRCRGRGAYRASTSNIDSHFSTGYKPALDVHLSDDNDDKDDVKTKKTTRPRPVAGLTDDIDDDWDMALEALRDRALWRQKGAERLREAGFEENVVDRFVNNKAFPGVGERNGSSGTSVDKDVAEVRWAKKGEGREWDRGKVVDEKGQVAIKTAWPE